MQMRLKEITPNLHNATLFVDSMSKESIGILAKDIERNGQYHAIRVTKIGSVIIDGERRWRACTLLGWKTIEVIQEDVKRGDILDLVIESVSSQRHMTLLEQARVYQTYHLHLKRSKAKGDLTHLAAKRIAMQKAHFHFRSTTLADQLVQVVQRGDLDLQEKLLRGDMSITGAYEHLQRRHYKPKLKEAPPKPPPTPQQINENRTRSSDAKEREKELEFTKRYVAAHREDLEKKSAQRKLLSLYEGPKPPAAPSFRENEEFRAIIEAFEALAVKEEPEKLVGRLAALIEAIVESVKGVDERRARDIVRTAVKPMVLRLVHQFPKQEFETPLEAD